MIGKEVGTYKITEMIGEGGMGAVFRGIDLMLEREVAVKMLRPELASQPHVVERFRSEAITLAKLNHPNVAMLYSFLKQDDDYFMVMEYVRGQTLDDVIGNVGAISHERAVPLFCQALEGIDHAHRMGIIHRDIKPANIMLTSTGSIKVMDFGIARMLGTARVTRHGNVVGTLEYMSPEQIRSEETDARSDVYSLGILLYEMLTGRVPFSNESDYELMRAQIEHAPTPPRTFAPQIPLATEQAIMRAIAKKQEARYQTAGDFRIALLANAGGNTTPLAAAPVYATPITRVMESPGSHTSAERPRATTVSEENRLSDGSDGQGVTRRTGGDEAGVARSLNSDGLQPDLPTETNQRPRESHRKLGVKLYVAAAALLVGLISVPVILIRARSQPSAPSNVTQPAESSPDARTEAGELNSSEGTVAGPPQPDGATRPDTGLNENKSLRSSNSNARIEKAEPAAGQPATGEPQASTGQQPTNPPAVQSKEDKTGAAKEGPKKDDNNQNKNAEKKSGGIGGFFKKVFGGGSDKKTDNKNKNQNQNQNKL